MQHMAFTWRLPELGGRFAVEMWSERPLCKNAHLPDMFDADLVSMADMASFGGKLSKCGEQSVCKVPPMQCRDICAGCGVPWPPPCAQSWP